MATGITIQSEGRRHYLVGNTYSLRDELRAAGAHWDAQRKAWWTSKRDVAERFAAGTAGESTDGAPDSGPRKDAPGDRGIVAGKATYKGKTFYLAGRVERGRTHYDDRVNGVSSRDGSRVLLYFRDGSGQFWAARSEIQIVKSYERPQSIGKLKRFAEEAREARRDGNSDGIPNGRCYECPECGELVVRGEGSCWETGAPH